MLSPPKSLDDGVRVTHINGERNVNFSWPHPLGPWGGSKGQISINFNYKVNFKDFIFQTLCVFSQMKDTKHIRRVFLFCRLGHALGVGLGGT